MNEENKFYLPGLEYVTYGNFTPVQSQVFKNQGSTLYDYKSNEKIENQTPNSNTGFYWNPRTLQFANNSEYENAVALKNRLDNLSQDELRDLMSEYPTDNEIFDRYMKKVFPSLTANEAINWNNFNSQLGRFENRQTNLKAADNFVSEGWGSRAWGTKVGLPMAAGVAGAIGGAYIMPELLGAMNLYAGFHGVKEGVKNAEGFWNALNKKDYEGAIWNGLATIGNGLETAFPTFIGTTNSYSTFNKTFPNFIPTVKNISKTIPDSYKFLTGQQNILDFIGSESVTNLLSSPEFANTPFGKRLAEVVMRTYKGGGLPINNHASLLVDIEEGGNLFNFKKPEALKYILFGNKNKNRSLLSFKTNKANYNGGISDIAYVDLENPELNKQYGDLLDSYLHDSELSPEAVTSFNKNEIFPEHQTYIKNNYSNKNIKPYDVNDNSGYFESLTQEERNYVINNGKTVGITTTPKNNNITFPTSLGRPDVGGFPGKFIKTKNGDILFVLEDIWKYNSKDFIPRYGEFLKPYKGVLNLIDNAGNPIVFRHSGKITKETPKWIKETFEDMINGEYNLTPSNY